MRAVGIELSAEVVATARAGLVAEGLQDRAEVLAAELRTAAIARRFDVVAMFNLIYYSLEAERARVLAKVAGHVAPVGFLERAGLRALPPRRPVPGEEYYRFVGRRV